MQNLHIANPSDLQNKIQKFKQDGSQKLHVVTDFDRTLTTNLGPDGKKTPTSISLVRDGGYLTPDYPGKAHALFNHYNPFEEDLNLDLDFRKKMMDEWWHAHMKLLVESGMNQAVVEDIISKNPRLFREGTPEFLSQLQAHNIPVLIFSAGITNMIQAYLESQELLYPNLHIFSNKFRFNEQGIAQGYENQVIHVLNKSEASVSDPVYREIIQNRRNIILLGDKIGDLGMTDNLDTDEIIRIGFLNESDPEKIQNKLKKYLAGFDLVITHDGSMEFPNYLLNEILS